MKISQIKDVLSVVIKASEAGERVAPLFVGPAGIGKSHEIAAVGRAFGYELIDIRAAYKEAPEVAGLPREEDGRMGYLLPKMWPTEGKYLILLDEINLAPPQVMSAFMEVLTEHSVNGLKLSPDAIIVAAINPESDAYDTNTMSQALLNRFAVYEVDFSMVDLITFAGARSWHPLVQGFLNSDLWKYQSAEECLKKNKRYVTSRNFERLSSMLKAASTDKLTLSLLVPGVLGQEVGASFVAFATEELPPLARDFLHPEASADAFRRLKKIAAPATRDNGRLTVTLLSVKDAEMPDEVRVRVYEELPPDLIVAAMVRNSADYHPVAALIERTGSQKLRTALKSVVRKEGRDAK